MRASATRMESVWPPDRLGMAVRVDCEPLVSHYRGEVLEINWNDKGWAGFFRKAQALWPEDQPAPF